MEISETNVRFDTVDGVVLRGTWIEATGPGNEVARAVIVACGAGVAARAYRNLARSVARRGAAVLVFDYRGIGESREGSIRKMAGGMEAWGAFDIEAAIAEARTRHPNCLLGAVAHSVGTLLIGAAPSAKEISRMVFLGPHTGYWGDYARGKRALLYVLWHRMMPMLTKRLGYFPGRSLRLGEDLPPQVALDWANRLRPSLIVNPDQAKRFGPFLRRYSAVSAHTLAISISDDAFAPPHAASRLLALYPNIRSQCVVVTPRSVHLRRLGHFGFLRQATGQAFWDRISEWLLQA